MPTNYTGDQFAVQAPAVAAEPEGSVLVRLPADGDPPNASTFAQALRVLADYVDFLLKPRPRSGHFARAVQRWRSAIGHTRFAVDHLGFPAGRFFQREMLWPDSPLSGTNKTGTGESMFATMPDWRYKAVESVDSTGFDGAELEPTAFGPAVRLCAGRSADDYVTISAGAFGSLRGDNHVALEFTAWDSGVAERQLSLGLVMGHPNTHVEAALSWIGVRVVAGLWEAVAKSGGAETTFFLGGVVTNLSARPSRIRIEWHGEAVSDDSNRSAMFFLNGTLVATFTTNLPTGAFVVAASDRRLVAGTVDTKSVLGPMRLSVSTHDQDAML